MTSYNPTQECQEQQLWISSLLKRTATAIVAGRHHRPLCRVLRDNFTPLTIMSAAGQEISGEKKRHIIQ